MKNPYTTQSQEDLQFFGSGSRIVLSSILFESGKKDTWATFDVFVRDMPLCRNYLIAAGVNDVINFLIKFKFTNKQVSYLKKNLSLSKAFVQYMKNMKLEGNIWAVPEGTPVFPNEPIMRLTVPLIFASVVEQYVINTIMHQTMLASKLSRVVNSAKGTAIGFVPVRTHGIDSALKAVRIGKMVGFTRADMIMSSFRENSITTGGLFTTHYFMLSYKNEMGAFQALAKFGGKNMALLIDTYDFDAGVKNFIKVAQQNKKNGIEMRAIAIDSGDLCKLSFRARKMLDAADLKEVKIVVASNLDEYSIDNLIIKKAPIDVFGPCTEILNVTDAPKLEVVYKMSELIENGKIFHKVKFSPGKISLPGLKQVFRIEVNGKYVRDILALDNEKRIGKRLLKPVIKSGKMIAVLPTLEESKKYYRKEISKLKNQLLSVSRKIHYAVNLSPKLSKLVKKIHSDHYIS